MLKFNFGYD